MSFNFFCTFWRSKKYFRVLSFLLLLNLLVFLLSLEFSWVCFLSVCLSFSTFRSYKYKKVWKSVIRYNKCSWIIRGISFQWLLIKFCGLIWWLFYNQTPVCSEKHLCILLYSILFCFLTSKSTSLPDDCYWKSYDVM